MMDTLYFVVVNPQSGALVTSNLFNSREKVEAFLRGEPGIPSTTLAPDVFSWLRSDIPPAVLATACIATLKKDANGYYYA